MRPEILATDLCPLHRERLKSSSDQMPEWLEQAYQDIYHSGLRLKEGILFHSTVLRRALDGDPYLAPYSHESLRTIFPSVRSILSPPNKSVPADRKAIFCVPLYSGTRPYRTTCRWFGPQVLQDFVHSGVVQDPISGDLARGSSGAQVRLVTVCPHGCTSSTHYCGSTMPETTISSR